MLWPFVIIFLAFGYLIQVRGFAWDEFNIERLFNNSDEVFGNIKIDQDQRVCVQDFKKLVDDLKSKQEWALKGRMCS